MVQCIIVVLKQIEREDICRLQIQLSPKSQIRPFPIKWIRMEGFSIFFSLLPNNKRAGFNPALIGNLLQNRANISHFDKEPKMFSFSMYILDIHRATPLLASWCANGAGGVLAAL